MQTLCCLNWITAFCVVVFVIVIGVCMDALQPVVNEESVRQIILDSQQSRDSQIINSSQLLSAFCINMLFIFQCDMMSKCCLELI